MHLNSGEAGFTDFSEALRQIRKLNQSASREIITGASFDKILAAALAHGEESHVRKMMEAYLDLLFVRMADEPELIRQAFSTIVQVLEFRRTSALALFTISAVIEHLQAGAVEPAKWRNEITITAI